MNLTRAIAISIALIVLAYALSSSILIVDQRQFALVLSSNQVVRVIDESGLQLKYPAPLQTIRMLDRRILTADNLEGDRFTTADKKNILVRSYMKWRITNPTKFFLNMKGDEQFAESQLNKLLRDALNQQISRHTIHELISDEPDQVMEAIRKQLTAGLGDSGIEVIDVRLTKVDFLAETTNAVYQSMADERQRLANQLRSIAVAESDQIRANAERQRETILAEGYRDAQKIKGAGDAKAAALYADAFNRDPQFAQFYQSLQAYRSTFKDKKDVMLLEPNGDFFKFLHKK